MPEVFHRQVVAEFGATPQNLHDLSVALNRLGAKARAMFEESLTLRRQIVEDFGATPERLRDIEFVIERLCLVDQ